MSDDEFTKLYKYFNNRLDTIEEKLEDKASKGDFDLLFQVVDSYSNRADTYMQEMLALGHKVRRIENKLGSQWHEQGRIY